MPAGKPGPVIPERYARALAGRDPIDLMKEAPRRYAKLVAGLTEAQMAKRPAPGKWSIREVLAHLADGEVVLGARYRFVVAHDRPPIAGYDQDAFVEHLAVDKARATDLLAAFTAVRLANVALLVRLPESAFDRIGIHAERGEESLAHMVAMYAGHDIVHEEQIETLRLAMFPPKTKRKPVRRSVTKTNASPKPKPKASAKKAKKR